MIDVYPNSDIGTIDNKFFNFFQDLMNNFGADLDEGFDRDMWVNNDDHDEYIKVADIYHAIKTQYPKY